MKERLSEGKLLLNPPNPMLGVVERAFIECGCEVWVGKRLDNMEVATTAGPCSPEHMPLVLRFNELMLESLESPSSADLVDVCELLLEKAASTFVLGS